MNGFVWSAVAIVGVFGALWIVVRLGVLATRWAERRPPVKRPTVKNPRLWN